MVYEILNQEEELFIFRENLNTGCKYYKYVTVSCETIENVEFKSLNIASKLFEIKFTAECASNEMLNVQLFESNEMELLAEETISFPCFTKIETINTPEWNVFVYNEILYLKSSEIIAEVYLFDVTGKQIWYIDNNFSNISSHPIGSLTKGVYLVTVKINNQFLHQKIWID